MPKKKKPEESRGNLAELFDELRNDFSNEEIAIGLKEAVFRAVTAGGL